MRYFININIITFIYTGKSEDELSSLALSYNLPTDLLELQEVSDGVDQLRIHAATVLGVDATFGPYSVHKLDLADGIKRETGQLTIKVKHWVGWGGGGELIKWHVNHNERL